MAEKINSTINPDLTGTETSPDKHNNIAMNSSNNSENTKILSKSNSINSNLSHTNSTSSNNNLISMLPQKTNRKDSKKTMMNRNLRKKLTKQQRAERYLKDRDSIIQCSTRGMLVVAFIFILSAIASMYFNGPERILSAAIGKIFRLQKGTDFYENWMNPDEPMKFNIYVFNLTNKEAFLKGQEKANLQEIGPYVYTLNVGRTIHEQNDVNLTYTNNRKFTFRPEFSNGLNDKTDLIYHINLPKLLMKASGAFVDSLFGFLKEIKVFEDASDLVDIHSVHEYLWGYEYDMLQMLQVFDDTKSSKFGMMEDQNGTTDPLTLERQPASYFAPKYTVLKGKENPSDLLKLVSFNGESRLSCWKNENVGNLGVNENITDIEQVSPGMLDAKVIEVFREEAFRTTKLYYQGQKEIPHGENWPIPVRRYEQKRESLDGKDYCANGSCDFVETGTVDISQCRPTPLNFPLLWSSPHFYNADESYRNNYTGLANQPDKEAHETYIDVEPHTGVVISAKRRSQISVSFKNVTSLSHLKTEIFPMFWYDFPYDASKKIKDDMSQSLVRSDFSLRLLPFVLVILAVILAGVSLALQCKVKKQYSRMSVEKDGKEANKMKNSDNGENSSGYASNDDDEENQRVQAQMQEEDVVIVISENPDNYDSEFYDSARTSADSIESPPTTIVNIGRFGQHSIRRSRPQTLSVSSFGVNRQNNDNNAGTFARNALTTPISNTIDLEQVINKNFGQNNS